MARNGTKNTGKKYVKLKGGEIATPDAQARADAFLQWYGANTEEIRAKLIYAHLYDDELATDTMLAIYDGIALKGYKVTDFKFYFLRAYHTNYVAMLKRRADVSLDFAPEVAAPEYDGHAYERAIDGVVSEMLDYVRGKYAPAECSLFEIYIGLLPDISYARLAKILGLKLQQVWPVIGAIRADLNTNFAARKEYLLTRV